MDARSLCGRFLPSYGSTNSVKFKGCNLRQQSTVTPGYLFVIFSNIIVLHTSDVNDLQTVYSFDTIIEQT